MLLVNLKCSHTNVSDSGIFYFTLGNIHPKYRSQFSLIHLVAVAKQKNLNLYGMDAVIRPFIDDLKKLASF